MEPAVVKIREVKPALTAYIGGIVEMLRLAPVPAEKEVHDIRVLLKKCRAAIKLLAPALNPADFKKEYIVYRDAGRNMAHWREDSVLRKSLRSLRKDNASLFGKLENIETIRKLTEQEVPSGNEPAKSPASPDPLVAQTIEALSKSAFRLRFMTLNTVKPELLLNELEKTYLLTVDSYVLARNNPKASNIHDFRKRAKDFLYQVWFFRSLNPSVIKALEKKIDSLTQYLGKYNDFDQLIKAFDYKYEVSEDKRNNPALDELILIIRERQDKYLSKAWSNAYRIFCPGQSITNLLGFQILTI